ncbi:MAG: hypothetical protein C4530_22995 [Desulfobacteraceae bacterium]|nr:MAG: hypothetical protein C4530_22995 [Desulfobacteraceae bacterium]
MGQDAGTRRDVRGQMSEVERREEASRKDAKTRRRAEGGGRKSEVNRATISWVLGQYAKLKKDLCAFA